MRNGEGYSPSRNQHRRLAWILGTCLLVAAVGLAAREYRTVRGELPSIPRHLERFSLDTRVAMETNVTCEQLFRSPRERLSGIQVFLSCDDRWFAEELRIEIFRPGETAPLRTATISIREMGGLVARLAGSSRAPMSEVVTVPFAAVEDSAEAIYRLRLHAYNPKVELGRIELHVCSEDSIIAQGGLRAGEHDLPGHLRLNTQHETSILPALRTAVERISAGSGIPPRLVCVVMGIALVLQVMALALCVKWACSAGVQGMKPSAGETPREDHGTS